MTRHVATVFLAFGAAAVHAGTKQDGQAFLGADGGERMRPDLVAKTLSRVEDEWRAHAAAFTEGNTSEAQTALDSFGHSCATVVAAVVQGSSGDRDIAKDYMANVCGQKVLAGWQKLRCNELATAISEHGMLADNYANRQILKPSKVCTAFWSKFVEAERNREAIEAKERAEQEAEQEKLRAEQEKKAAMAAAEAKKKADAEAQEKKKKKEQEDARRAKEEERAKAKKAAAEAKERAAAAAARLAQKKAEAEEVQRVAQQKLEEAAKAEKEHQARLAEHEKAAEMLRNASVSGNSSETVVNPTTVANTTSNNDVEPVMANVTSSKDGAAPANADARPNATKPTSKL